MMPHRPSHWILVALVILAAVFTLSEVHGQPMSRGAEARFEGRPAMAGAQAGLGAQAGPPQGGLGVQGTEAADNVKLRRPRDLELSADMPQGEPESTDLSSQNTSDAELRARGERRTTERDTGFGRGVGSSPASAAAALRRQAERLINGNVAAVR
jgi:hypothetical protein